MLTRNRTTFGLNSNPPLTNKEGQNLWFKWFFFLCFHCALFPPDRNISKFSLRPRARPLHVFSLCILSVSYCLSLLLLSPIIKCRWVKTKMDTLWYQAFGTSRMRQKCSRQNYYNYESKVTIVTKVTTVTTAI